MIVPYNTKKRVLEVLENTFPLKIIRGTVVQSQLIGLYSVGNKNGVLFPDLLTKPEYEILRSEIPDNVEIGILNSKITALGNTITCDERKAIIHPDFTAKEAKYIEDTLDVEVVKMEIMSNPLVGSIIVQNSWGLLTHPMVPDDDLEYLRQFFNKKIGITTVNRGTPYPKSGILSNSKGILVGGDTTGPEIARIFEVMKE